MDVLKDFPSITLTLGVLLEILPRIQPRFYSISSSPAKYPNQVHITVGKLYEEIPSQTPPRFYSGLCSTYLCDVKAGDYLFAYRQEIETKFRLPEDPSKGIIMVGAGTGVAPFRGFLQGW